MIKLKQIYFDGQGYAKYLIESNEASSQDEIDIANVSLKERDNAFAIGEGLNQYITYSSF